MALYLIPFFLPFRLKVYIDIKCMQEYANCQLDLCDIDLIVLPCHAMPCYAMLCCAVAIGSNDGGDSMTNVYHGDDPDYATYNITGCAVSNDGSTFALGFSNGYMQVTQNFDFTADTPEAFTDPLWVKIGGVEDTLHLAADKTMSIIYATGTSNVIYTATLID
jgi:hypothetical protein